MYEAEPGGLFIWDLSGTTGPRQIAGYFELGGANLTGAKAVRVSGRSVFLLNDNGFFTVLQGDPACVA
jgi:hypothetical protein